MQCYPHSAASIYVHVHVLQTLTRSWQRLTCIIHDQRWPSKQLWRSRVTDHTPSPQWTLIDCMWNVHRTSSYSASINCWVEMEMWQHHHTAKTSTSHCILPHQVSTNNNTFLTLQSFTLLLLNTYSKIMFADSVLITSVLVIFFPYSRAWWVDVV